MGDYFKYIIARLLIGILFVVIVYNLNSYLFQTKHSAIFKGVKHLIVGDSHFNGIAINQVMHMGQDSEVYYTMLQKIKEVNRHSELKNVVIAYSYLNFSKNYFDDFLLSNDVQSYSISKRNYPLASITDQFKQSTFKSQLIKVLSRFNVSFNFNYMRSAENVKKNLPFMWYQENLSVKHNLTFLKRTQDARKRKIVPSSARYKNNVAAKMERLFINDDNEISHTNLSYLDEILVYCEANIINVTLVSTPLESYYFESIPKYMKDAFYNHTQDILKTYANVQFLDYTHHFEDTAYFIDEHHVGGYGAALLSIEIGNHIFNK